MDSSPRGYDGAAGGGILGVAAVAAGGAAALSALVGVIAGIPLGALVLRALGGGIFFGALVAGGFFLLGKLLPELFTGDGDDAAVAAPEPERGIAGASSSESAPHTGRNVNIVLPGGGDEEALDAVSDTPDSLLSGSSSGAELASEDDSLIEAEEAPLQVRPETGLRPPAALDELDVLPDLETLSDGFVEPPPEGGSFSESGSSEASSRSSGAVGGNSDPAVIAQAVRTLLKRDQKG